jgi:exopolyphosphatase/guanosine-5'-triphosphate,3'-diphosphate pyrophosphatase
LRGNTDFRTQNPEPRTQNPEPRTQNPVNPKAVIDIGTNTINLLIASYHEEGFVMELFERIPAKLGQGGMQDGLLTEAAMERGLDALADHLDTCEDFNVEEILVTATSAVRSAENRQEFIDSVWEELGLDINVIDGEREAELIWKGVRMTGLAEEEAILVMDIGGGSTEFIIAQGEEVMWKKSYDLGVTRLKERFKASDPITEQELTKIKEELRADMEELWIEGTSAKVKTLVGASGSFNSIDLMLALGDVESLPEVRHRMDLTQYARLSHKVAISNYARRSAIPGLVPDRVDTIPYSFILIDMVLDILGINEMWRSSYALKEGLMAEMFGA